MQSHQDQQRATPLPIDPDLPTQRPRLLPRAARLLRRRWDILTAIAAGGALGSAARYAVAEALPHQPGQFPWSTVVVNLSGGFLLGLLMVFVLDVWPTTRYVRPFLGVGVLGGFTTFSTYMVDTRALLVSGEAVAAGVYLFGTLLAGLIAVWLGILCARVLSRPRHRSGTRADAQANHPARDTTRSSQ